MVFTSYLFLFVFLPGLLLALFRASPRRRNRILLLASYLFYGMGRADFVLLLVFSTVVDYTCARRIAAAPRDAVRRAWLLVSIASNLGLLGYFKYFDFGAENISWLIEQLGGGPLTWESVALPIGISFFTFQTLSYTIDVYRRQVAPSTDLWDFACYVAMFPQLVAGPIVRYRSIETELRESRVTTELFASGVLLFMIGLNKKVLLANNFGWIADAAFGLDQPGTVNAWAGAVAYSLQLYFDFSGYSDMAMGLGRMLGFHYPVNFDSPYRAVGITDFWRRWHISLSTWLRDYLYIPLGGSRGSRLRTGVNLQLTMILGGLWHGASWNFVAWGAFHGTWLVSERILRRFSGVIPRPLAIALTSLGVLVGWVLFRAETLPDAITMLRALVGADGAPILFELSQPFWWVLGATGLAIVYFARPSWRLAEKPSSALVYGQLFLFWFAVHELLGQGFNPFLYFQF